MNNNDNTLNVIKYIKEHDNQNIKDALPEIIYNIVQMCEQKIGEGGHGIVKKLNYGNIVSVYVKDTYIIMRTVIKQYKHIGKYDSLMYTQKDYIKDIEEYKKEQYDYEKLLKVKIPKNLTVFYGEYHPLYETIGLMYLSKMWYDELTPHVPYLIMPMTCNTENMIDHLLLEMNGLINPINSDRKRQMPGIYDQTVENTYLETVNALLKHISSNFIVENNKILCWIPNLQQPDLDEIAVEVVDVIELIDSLTLSFLFTYEHVWREAKMILTDQYTQNVFIHWLSDGSHMGKRNIMNTKEIVYLVKNKKYKIRTNGIILKIGDVGSSVIKPKEDLMIIIDLNDKSSVQKAMYLERIPTYIEFIGDVYYHLPKVIAEKTIVNQILTSKEFETYSTVAGGVNLDDPHPIDLIEKYFKKFSFDDYDSNIDPETIVTITF